MKSTICLFEDEGFRNLLPLAYTRPVYDLRCGILSLREKVEARFPGYKIILHSRIYLEKVLKERNPEIAVNQFDSANVLFINGRLLVNPKSAGKIKKLETDSILSNEVGEVIAANLSAKNLMQLNENRIDFLQFDKLNGIAKSESDITLIKYPWDLVNANGKEIVNDYELLVKKPQKINSKNFRAVEFINKNNIFVSKDSKIDPFVFLDASNGPIFIGNGAHIMSHSSIEGPVFIGNNSVIKAHASIYSNTSVGEVCKIGGEVESSIIHSYSNKQHEGFLGHSYLGSWINLGAGTNNSDLKNNYANVSVLLNGESVNTCSLFVGLTMGDHSKTAINSKLNTGTVIGVSCNIFGSGFPPRFVPSFSWGGSDSIEAYKVSKCLEVAKIVMGRRKVELTEAEANLLKHLFELTALERSVKVSS